MPLSFSPPLIGVAVAPEHETYKMILDAFGMNWLEYWHAEQVSELGGLTRREFANKLFAVRFTSIKGSKTAQPLIKETVAAIECRVRERLGTGRMN